ncbi:MAG: nucleotidyltransferase family protein, partial [Rhodospirillales bacterium]|nr:nucleotidyltransferase family protein [Rhodospirillales bacterium]
GGMLIDHLAARPDFDAVISDESDRLMDSGGGVAKALPLLVYSPFLILNGDSFWLEAPDTDETNLSRMATAWDPQQMDMLIMTAPMDQAIGYDGKGDTLADAAGRLRRYDRHTPEPHVYAGVIMTHPGIFADAPDEPFSLNWCFDRAIAAGRLFGMPSRSLWLTVGTPEAVGEAEAAMRAFRAAEAAAEGLP